MNTMVRHEMRKRWYRIVLKVWLAFSATLLLAAEPFAAILVRALPTTRALAYSHGGVVTNCGVMQGGASDGVNLFFACADSKKDIRIFKTTTTGQIISKSETFSRSVVGHVNDMTYNSKTNLLVIAAEDWGANPSLYSVIRFVDPTTLKLTDEKRKLSDGTGASSVCYNSATDQYVVRGKLFDSNFKYLNKRIYTHSGVSEDTQTEGIDGKVLVQGIECDKNYIYTMRVVWGENGYNMLSVYDWNGKNAGTYKIGLNDEGENLIRVGNYLYMGINEGGMSKGGNSANDYFIALGLPETGCEPDGSDTLITNAFKAKNNAYFTGGTCCSTTPTGLGQASAVEGSKAQEKLLRFFTGKGFTLAQAAGIAGNVQQESSFNPEAKNSGSGAYGLFQWLGSRYSNNKKGVDSLVEYAAQNNLNVSDVDAQLGFAWLELNTTEKATLIAFASNMNMSVAGATNTWSVKFERAGAAESNNSTRVKYAEEIHDAFKGTIPDGTGIDVKGLTPDSATAGSSTTSTCGNLTATTCTPHEPIGDRGAAQHAAIFGKFEDQSNWIPVNKFMDFTFKTKSASSGALINKKAEPCLRAVENELQTATKYPVWSFMCSRLGEGQPKFYHGYAAACDINPSKSGKGNGCGFCAGWGTNNHDIPQDWVDIFEKYGWYWGGHWGGGTNGDWMHFQYEGDQSDANSKRTPGAV